MCVATNLSAAADCDSFRLYSVFNSGTKAGLIVRGNFARPSRRTPNGPDRLHRVLSPQGRCYRFADRYLLRSGSRPGEPSRGRTNLQDKKPAKTQAAVATDLG